VDWSLVVIFIAAAVGAYIGGRWKEKGRIDAVSKSLAKVVEQERGRAFAQEAGKQEAVLANLDKIEEQVRAVTITQREIEAKISSEVWDRQWRVNETLKVYTQVLRAMHDYMTILYDILSELRSYQSGSTTAKELRPVAENFFDAYALARLLLSPEAVRILKSTQRWFLYHVSIKPDDDGSDANNYAKKIEKAIEELLAVAHLDLPALGR
jgi:hypothetical protein